MSEASAVLGKLQKNLGSQIGSQGLVKMAVPRIPTGIFPMDLALGGGFPLGKCSEIYGMESCGKTTIALLVAGYCQRITGQKVVFIEVENTLDGTWAEKLGVNLNDLVVIRPDTAEQTVDCHEAFMYAQDVGMVILDSVGSLVTSNEIEKEAEVAAVGGPSAIVSKMMRKCVAALTHERKREHYPTPIFINQIRHKIGQMYGNPETTPGGNLIRFAQSIRVKLYSKDKMLSATDDLPSLKETNGTIMKWKVPIFSKSFEYEMALRAHDGLKIGQAHSWNTVATRLKNAGALVKADKGQEWTCLGYTVKTLEELKAVYMAEEKVRLELQGEVVRLSLGEMLPPQKPKKGETDDGPPVS